MDKSIYNKMKKTKTLIEIENDEKNPIIVVKKVFKKDPYFQKYIDERENYLKDVNIEKYIDIMKYIDQRINIKKYIFKRFTKKEKYETININEININEYINKIPIARIKKGSFKNFYVKTKSLKNIDDIKNKNVYDYQKLYFKNKKIYFINFLYLCYFYLNKNDNVIMNISWLSYQIINIVYLATIYFEKVYIIGKSRILLLNFKDDLTKIDIIKKIIKDNYHFDILNKKNIKEIIKNNKLNIEIDNYFKYNIYIKDKIYLYYEYTIYKKIKEILDLKLDKFKKLKKEVKKLYNDIKLKKDNKETKKILNLLNF